jgi:uncharacterized protein (TIGR00269 family)
VKCSSCGRKAVIYIAYSGRYLCERHFFEFLERRVRQEFKKQADILRGSKIAVAVSGGKDSVTAMHLTYEIMEPRGVEVEAISIDEGTPGYRDKAIEKALMNSRELGIEHHVVRYKDVFGITTMDIAMLERDKSPCSYCGVLRRWLLNRTAREIGADFMVTGLTLDDTAQSILMNFTKGDMERLARLGPHTKVQEGLIRRLQPLRSIPERETYLYATLKGYPFHESRCPYAGEALRNEYRAIINDLEDRHPGTRHAIINSYDAIRPLLEERFRPAKLNRCERCGEPTPGRICMACRMLDELRFKMKQRESGEN